MIITRLPRPQLRWPTRWKTLRLRVTVIASLVITGAVLAGLVLLYLLQIQSVHRTLDQQLRTYATDVAQSGRGGTWPATLPTSALDANAEAQVLTSDGTVVAATSTLRGRPAIYNLPSGSTTPVRLKAADAIIPTDVRVIALRATIAGKHYTIITGTPTTLLTQLRGAFTSNLLLGFPVILAGTALAVWLIVGRALRPVDRIRHAVTDITAADLSRRVPETGAPDEIGNLAHTMNDMLARLDASATRQRRFIADASHELRSPLAAIRTTLEVGLAHPAQAPWPVIAARAAQQTQRLEDLVQHLLQLAKADERLLATKAEQVEIAALARAVCADMPPNPIKIHFDGEHAWVHGNPDNLSRLLRNVIHNAARYADTTVHVAVRPENQQVLITISDDGPGIPEPDRERIFERFVRLDTSRDRTTGNSGLGLALAREIVTAHHGRIAAEPPYPESARGLLSACQPPPCGVALPAEWANP